MDRNVSWPGLEVVRRIGSGSFGAVYEIQRDMLGDIEKAALKVISIPQNDSDIEELYSDGFDEESVTSTFQNYLKNIIGEYSLMRKMNGCANVVNCDDVRYVQHDDGIGWDVYIKMELLTPLTKALPAEVTEETVIQIAKDLCAALVVCKKYDIVHRDIKPQNIFVSPNGDYKLGDFGIAKTVEKTTGGTKIGTYKYMAPEVYHSQPYGSGADIYSLGLVLYWLLNERRMPFMPLPPAKLTAGMDEESRHRRLSGEPIPAPIHGSDALKAIVLKACAFDPGDRFASAADMLQALQAVAGAPALYQQPTQETATEDATVGIWNQTPQNQPAIQKPAEEAATEDAAMGIWPVTYKETEKVPSKKNWETQEQHAEAVSDTTVGFWPDFWHQCPPLHADGAGSHESRIPNETHSWCESNEPNTNYEQEVHKKERSILTGTGAALEESPAIMAERQKSKAVSAGTQKPTVKKRQLVLRIVALVLLLAMYLLTAEYHLFNLICAIESPAITAGLADVIDANIDEYGLLDRFGRHSFKLSGYLPNKVYVLYTSLLM